MNLYDTPDSTNIQHITIGNHRLPLDMRSKHESKAYQNWINGVSDVDVAIAERLLKPGDKVLDLGANIGFVALHYLRLGAKEVHSFEPNPYIFKRLEKVVTDGLSIYQLAISDQEGILPLTLSITHNQGSTLCEDVVNMRRNVFGNELKTINVKTVSIDEFFKEKLQEPFNYIKVDIEGAELDFLKGANNLLNTFPPRVLQFEIKPEFKSIYIEELNPFFQFARRVDYDRKTGQIVFNTVDGPFIGEFKNSPPNYIFYNDRNLL